MGGIVIGNDHLEFTGFFQHGIDARRRKRVTDSDATWRDQLDSRKNIGAAYEQSFNENAVSRDARKQKNIGVRTGSNGARYQLAILHGHDCRLRNAWLGFGNRRKSGEDEQEGGNGPFQ
jgi:hypothetical protein